MFLGALAIPFLEDKNLGQEYHLSCSEVITVSPELDIEEAARQQGKNI